MSESPDLVSQVREPSFTKLGAHRGAILLCAHLNIMRNNLQQLVTERTSLLLNSWVRLIGYGDDLVHAQLSDLIWGMAPVVRGHHTD